MKKSSIKEKNVFIIGSKGIPAKYGGFETFVDFLTKYSPDKNVKYHVACISDNHKKEEKDFTYNGAHCFKIKVPNIGSAKAVIYDIKSLKYSLKHIKKNNIQKPIIYILACRIGPFIKHYKKQIKKYDGLIFVNPDGHEWLRAKWNKIIKKYWKISERLMIKYADTVICDNSYIKKYIDKEYKKYNPNTTFIAYGYEIPNLEKNSGYKQYKKWLRKYNIKPNNYYLAVGRLVPENNFETMLIEFMKSNTTKDFVLINNKNDKYYNILRKKVNFEKDKRIKFVNTVYDQEILTYIRKAAYAYIHGHEVGGTNPSLIEAAGIIDLNLVFNVCFNKEVTGKNAFYWNKNSGDLSRIIDKVEKITNEEKEKIGIEIKKHIKENYNWNKIVKEYNDIFKVKN